MSKRTTPELLKEVMELLEECVSTSVVALENAANINATQEGIQVHNHHRHVSLFV